MAPTRKIIINGISFDFGVSSVATTTVGGTTFDLDFDGSGFTITNNAGGNIPQADLQAILRTVQYDNLSALPTLGARQFNVIPQDSALANSSPIAVSTITVAANNSAPQGTDNTVSVNEDNDYVFAVADFGFSDPIDGDALSNVIIATVPTNGVLYVDTNGDGSVDGGEALSNLDPVTIADITAGRLKFKPAPDGAGSGYDSFTFQVQDDGGTANGGIDTDQTANTITIDVTGVNDAPVRLTGSVNNLTVNEDSGFTSLGLGAVTYGPGGGADEVGQTLSYNVTILPDPVAFGRIFLADGTTQVTIGSYTLTQIQGMQFRPQPDAIGGPSFFSFQVVDNGGVANGGADTLGQTIQLNITPVNDSDPVANDDAITVNEGATATVLDTARHEYISKRYR